MVSERISLSCYNNQNEVICLSQRRSIIFLELIKMSGQNSVIGYQSILDYLYSKYYQNFSGYSSVTSSHWRQDGWQQVNRQDGEYFEHGIGFGSYEKRNVLNRLKVLPRTLLLTHLFQKYSCPDHLIQSGLDLVRRNQWVLSFDSVKQILSLGLISKVLNSSVSDVEEIRLKNIDCACIIGDGYGFFSGLVKHFKPDIQTICVNLGRTLLFDVLSMEKTFPDETPILLLNGNDSASEYNLIFIEAENCELLKTLRINLFVNIASMQEMNPPVIEKYFDYMRASSAKLRYFYCCNRLSKHLPDGTLVEFMQYPWKKEDIVLIDEICPWYQRYPISTPPFWQAFDGVIQHRLIKF